MALKPLTWNQFDDLKVDEETGLLHWRELPLVSRQKVSLEWPTFILAAVATGAGVVAAVWPILVHFGVVGAAVSVG
jgi:hypothetical protein